MPTLLRPRTLPYAGLSVLVALALAGCGGGSSTTNGPAPVGGSTPAPTGTGGAGNGQRQPGTTGLIAAVNGSTMQVQTRTDQTAVTWSDSTAFSKQVVATLADVTTGSCITVLEPQATVSATPGAAAAAPTSVTAATVQVRPATGGQCTGGFGGGPGGGGGAGNATGAPNGAPTRTGTAGPDGTGGAGGGFGRRAVNGLVTAVSGSTITVQETMRGGAGAGGAPTGSATTDGSTTGAGGTAEGTTQIVTVTTTGSTAYLAEKQASPSDVAVGECATATGKPDDTGAVAATAVALRPAANGSCTNGGTGRPTGSSTGSATTGTANG